MSKLLPVVFVWDFDGVVVFTPHYEAWRLACEHYGFHGFTREFYDQYVSGRPRIEGAMAILERLGGYSRSSLLEGYGRRILQEFMEYKNTVFRKLVEEKHFTVNMDAVEYILKAKNQGIIQVLASASKNAELIAKHAYLPSGKPLVELFDLNVSGKASSKKEVFMLAQREASRLILNPKCFIVYEDAPSGIIAGRELGFKTVGYRLPQHVDPDIIGVDLVLEKLSVHDPLEITLSLGCRI